MPRHKKTDEQFDVDVKKINDIKHLLDEISTVYPKIKEDKDFIINKLLKKKITDNEDYVLDKLEFEPGVIVTGKYEKIYIPKGKSYYVDQFDNIIDNELNYVGICNRTINGVQYMFFNSVSTLPIKITLY